MKRVFGRGVIAVCVVAAALIGAPSVLAETTTTCDNMCGDSQACKYTCCHITTSTVKGVDLITKVSCSSSVCCAHPQGEVVGGSLGLPAQVVEGVSAPIKWGLVETTALDASTIAVESNDQAGTVTLSGTVKSAAQRRQAGAIAAKHAKGYKVLNRLTIVK